MEEAITLYYQKKSAYDKEYERKKEAIRNNDGLSISEKREKIKNIERKCIVCGSNRGTIFSKSSHVLRAICGNRANPCSLNIQIELPVVVSHASVEKNYENEITLLKDDIILSKYNILFNFSQFDDNFIKKTDQIREKIAQYEKIMKTYDLQYEKATQLEKRQQQLKTDEFELQVKIKEFKNIMSSDVNNALQLYKDIMIPLIEKIRNNKYDYIDVVTETSDGNILKNDDKTSKDNPKVYSRLVRDLISLNNEMIYMSRGSVDNLEVKKVTSEAKKLLKK